MEFVGDIGLRNNFFLEAKHLDFFREKYPFLYFSLKDYPHIEF